jgi:gag-polypeptide of LTR copia-type/Zinc knuckle
LKIQNPNAEEGQLEFQPSPMSQEEFNNSEEVQTWIQKEENAFSLLMRVLGDDIVIDLMNELSDPVAMLNVLESTYSSKTGTNILTMLNGVVTKKLGRNHRTSTHFEHLDILCHQLTSIQGSYEGKLVRESVLLLLVTSSRYACFWYLFLMLENIMQSLKQFGAYLMKTERRTTELSKPDSLSRLVQKHPEKGSIFGSKRMHHVHHKHGKSVGATLARDDKDSITFYTCGKNGHYARDCRSKPNIKANQALPKGSKATKGKGSSSKSPKDSFMIMAAVAESDNDEDPMSQTTQKKTVMSMSQTTHKGRFIVPQISAPYRNWIQCGHDQDSLQPGQ